MSKTHRKHEPTHPQVARDSRGKLPSQRDRMRKTLEFPSPDPAPLKPLG